MATPKLLEWKYEYSVNVKELDEQHKLLFSIINSLITEISATPDKKRVAEIVTNLQKYKAEHFALEEKYFAEFKYPEAEDHIKKHREFASKVAEIQQQFGTDTIGLAFALVDYLETWLIDHLMGTDHRYIKWFNDHGLY